MPVNSRSCTVDHSPAAFYSSDFRAVVGSVARAVLGPAKLLLIFLTLTLPFGVNPVFANQVCTVTTLPSSNLKIATLKFSRQCPNHVPGECEELGNGAWQCSSGGFSDGLSGVSVQGNTIVLPRGRWYQIQNARSYATLYEGVGGGRHNVPDGEYHVINLISNSRINFLKVPSGSQVRPSLSNRSASKPANSTVRVTDSAIVLPADGWYQIQNANTMETVYEGRGGTTRTVPRGTFHVINHTTGARTEFLDVPGRNARQSAEAAREEAAREEAAREEAAREEAARAARSPVGNSGNQAICERSTVLSNNQISANRPGDYPSLSHSYSKRQAVNADETRLVLAARGTYVFDIVNGRVANRRDINVSSEVMWSEFNPDLLYAIQSNNRFVSYDLASDTYRTLFDVRDIGFDSSHRLTIGDYEGQVQKDRYVVLRMTSGSRGTDRLVSLDISSNRATVLGQIETPSNFNWAGFSPDGKTIVIGGNSTSRTYSVHHRDFSYIRGETTPPGNGEYKVEHGDWVVMDNGENVFVLATDGNNSIHNPRTDAWSLIGTEVGVNGARNSGHISGLASKRVPGLYLASNTARNLDSYIVKLTGYPDHRIEWTINIGQIWGGTANYRDQTKATISPGGKYIIYNKPVNGVAQSFLMTMDNSRCS